MHLNVYLSTLLASLAVIAADASADVFQHKDKQLSSAKAVVSQSSSTRRAVASVFEQVTLPDGRSLQDVCEPLMNELIACEISNCPNAECNDAESSAIIADTCEELERFTCEFLADINDCCPLCDEAVRTYYRCLVGNATNRACPAYDLLECDGDYGGYSGTTTTTGSIQTAGLGLVLVLMGVLVPHFIC